MVCQCLFSTVLDDVKDTWTSSFDSNVWKKQWEIIIFTLRQKTCWKLWKSLTIFGPIREQRSQGEPLLQNFEGWGHSESYSSDLLTWNRSCQNHKPIDTLHWQFWWIFGDWLWTSLKVRKFWGHRP
jgi:hypothetical protein